MVPTTCRQCDEHLEDDAATHWHQTVRSQPRSETFVVLTGLQHICCAQKEEQGNPKATARWGAEGDAKNDWGTFLLLLNELVRWDSLHRSRHGAGPSSSWSLRVHVFQTNRIFPSEKAS